MPISPQEHIDIINGLDLTQEQREDIFWRNANRMFGLALDTAATATA